MAELSPVPPLPKKTVKGVTQGGAIGSGIINYLFIFTYYIIINSDKPVTFRSTVKSSGYLQSPR